MVREAASRPHAAKWHTEGLSCTMSLKMRHRRKSIPVSLGAPARTSEWSAQLRVQARLSTSWWKLARHSVADPILHGKISPSSCRPDIPV